MQSTVGINQGIEIVFHKVKNEMGLAYTKQRDLLVGSEKVNEGYLFDDPSFSVTHITFNPAVLPNQIDC